MNEEYEKLVSLYQEYKEDPDLNDIGKLNNVAVIGERFGLVIKMIDDLQDQIVELKKERDLAIAHDTQPYPTADAYEKVCLVNDQRRKMLEDMAEFHPRAMKLLAAKKPFLVVSETEVYYGVVYNIIRNNEKASGTWTEEDESRYQAAIEKWDRE